MSARCPHCGGALRIRTTSVVEVQADNRNVVREVAAALGDEPQSANAIARAVRRRQADVRAALAQLDRAGRAYQAKGGWTR